MIIKISDSNISVFFLDCFRFQVDNDNLKITNYDHLKFTKNGKF